jgi:hypothetical protein
MSRLILLSLTILLVPSRLSAQEKKFDFAHDVLPLLKTHCAECHTNGTYKGGFSLDTRESVLQSKSKPVVPGKSDASELIRRVLSKDPELRMPPKGPALTAAQVESLKKWIDMGLPWETGFTFKKSTYTAPLKPRMVQVLEVPGMQHPIDRLLHSYFQRHKVSPPPPADDVAFLRRVYSDLIGLLPTPAEVEAFRSNASATKRNEVIVRLLAENRAFADHWLSFWNDMLRNDYQGTGYIDGGRKPITSWLYTALAENKPYDVMTRELISPTAESEGFINGIKWRGNVNASQVREVQFAQNVSQVFFGANLKCASCHDSFIDSWKLRDAYGLAAVVADQPLEIHRCDKPTGEKAEARFLWPELGAIDLKATKAIRLKQVADLVTHPENGRFQRTIVNRLWHKLMGRGIVHPVDMMETQPWNEELLDYLGNYLVQQKYDLRKVLEHIASSQAYQARVVPSAKELIEENYVFRGPELKRMTAEQFLDGIWMVTQAGPKTPTAKAAKPIEFSAQTPEERRLVRASLLPADSLQRALGRPNREQVVTSRPEVLTTLQALELSNGQVVADTLTRGAQSWLKTDPKATPEELAIKVYLRALNRIPSPTEKEVAVAVLGEKPSVDALADLFWIVLMQPEFQLVR